MADRGGGAARGGFGSRGDRGGDRGRGDRRGRRGPRRGGNKSEEKEWQPVTKLGRLVKAGKIKSMEEIYLHSLPIKEYQIVDFFLPKLKDEVMKVCFLMINTTLLFEKGGADSFLRATDQTRPEANPCWSTNAFQGHRCHWRLRGARWIRNQDFERSRYSHPCRHHHCQAQRSSHPKRVLGYLSWRTALFAYEGEW